MNMPQYDEDFKKRIVRLHLEEGRTLKSLADEYGASKAAISKWVKTYREECLINQETKNDYDYMKENLRLRKQLEEMEKENRFLKKAAAFFAKESD
jgi:Transposase.